jgi:hypothetical protein
VSKNARPFGIMTVFNLFPNGQAACHPPTGLAQPGDDRGYPARIVLIGRADLAPEVAFLR